MSNRNNAPPLPEPVKTRPLVVKLTIASMIAALFVWFLIQNNEDVSLEFLGWQGSIPLSLLLVISGIAAIVIWELAGYLRRRKR